MLYAIDATVCTINRVVIHHIYIVCNNTSQVRNADVGWKETKKSLRKDHRWGMADALSKSDKETLFKEHIENLNRRKKEQFRKLLDETHEVCSIELRCWRRFFFVCLTFNSHHLPDTPEASGGLILPSPPPLQSISAPFRRYKSHLKVFGKERRQNKGLRSHLRIKVTESLPVLVQFLKCKNELNQLKTFL